VPVAAAHVAHHHQPGVDAHTDRQSDAPLLLHTRIQSAHSRDHTQPGAYSTRRVVFVGVWIAKVDQEPIAQILRDRALEALDHLGTGLLIGTYDLTQVFRVELRGEAGRVHQVAEQHRELAALGLRRAPLRGRQRDGSCLFLLRGWRCWRCQAGSWRWLSEARTAGIAKGRPRSWLGPTRWAGQHQNSPARLTESGALPVVMLALRTLHGGRSSR